MRKEDAAIEAAVFRLTEPFAMEMGYELVSVEFDRKRDAASELVICIDKPGGVSIEDCENFSRAIDEPLDEADPIPVSYVLIVSSPGLDRPLKTDRDLTRETGKSVEIKLFSKIDGKKSFVGDLQGFDDESITIDCDGNKRAFARKSIALVRLHVEF